MRWTTLKGDFHLLVEGKVMASSSFMDELLVPELLIAYPSFVGGYSLPLLGNQSFFRDTIPPALTRINRHLLAQALGVPPEHFVAPHLAHGSRILPVGKQDRGRGALEPQGAPEAVDGLITKERGVFLLTTAADCLPLLAFSPEHLTCASVHCGRRSLEKNILAEMVGHFVQLGSPPSSLRIILGPCIRRCCYEVDELTARQFATQLGASWVEQRHGKWYLDLPGAAKARLSNLGVPRDQMEEIAECTVCHPRGYFSYRKDGDWFQTLAAVIGVREDE